MTGRPTEEAPYPWRLAETRRYRGPMADIAGIGVRWTYAFLDRPREAFDAAAAFWTAVTGSTLSARRGSTGEFATFLPPEGDAFVKLQAVGSGPDVHLDFEIEDVRYAVTLAADLGAGVLADHGHWAVLASPAGVRFCLVPWHGATAPPAPTTHPAAGRSRLDQVCIDVGPADHERELRFWTDLTGWPLSAATIRPEFSLLRPPQGLPVQLLVQRLDADRPGGAHVDLACSDVAAATAYHVSLGARMLRQQPWWTVLADPAGGTYCLTARDPT